MGHRDGYRRPQTGPLCGNPVQPDANGEALGDSDPVQRASDGGQSRTGTDLVGTDSSSETLDVSFQRMILLGEQPDARWITHRDLRELRLAEIADRVPLVGLDEGKERPPGRGECALGNIEADDEPIEGCAKGRVLEVPLGQRQSRFGGRKLGVQRVGVTMTSRACAACWTEAMRAAWAMFSLVTASSTCCGVV
jgi:hypothetical protein